MKSLQKKTDVVANKLATSVEEQHRLNDMMELGMMVGASSAVHAMAQSTLAKTIQILQHIRDTEAYKAQAFTRFDDFLDASPHSPMSYRTFNRYENLLKEEGETIFETLNSLGVPVSIRKLLAGSVEINNDQITIGEEVINVTDKPAVKAALKSLAETRANEQKKIEKLEKKLEKGETENEELQREIEKLREGSAVNNSSEHPHTQAVMMLIGAYKNLSERAQELTEEEAQQLAPNTFETIAALNAQLQESYGYTPKTLTHKPKTKVKGSDSKTKTNVISELSDDELSELMED